MAQSPNGNAQPPSPPSRQEPPKPQPYGPGLLMVFGFALLGLAAWAAGDLFFKAYTAAAEDKPAQWAAQPWLIAFNWGLLAAGIGGAIYSFILAVRRSRKPPEPQA